MNRDWHLRKVGELLETQNGYAFPSKQFSASDGMPLIRIRDLKNGRATETNFLGSYDEKYVVRSGDYLVSMDGEFTCYEWKGAHALLNQRVCRLENFSEELHPKFLFYRINDYLKAIEDVTAYTTVKHLSARKIKNIEILLPPLTQQKRIVAILDEAFEAIDKAKEKVEKNLFNAKELFESYLHGVFANPGDDWEKKKLEEITTKIGSGATPKGGRSSYKESGISLIRSQNVYDEGFSLENLAFIDEIQASKLDNVTIVKGDVLLNITGASIARCCVVPNAILPARVNQHVSILRPIENLVHSNFLFYSLISKHNKNRLLDIARAGGSTREALTKKALQVFSVDIPKSLEEQGAIIAKLDALHKETMKLESIYQQKLNNIEELRKSILQKAFNGEL